MERSLKCAQTSNNGVLDASLLKPVVSHPRQLYNTSEYTLIESDYTHPQSDGTSGAIKDIPIFDSTYLNGNGSSFTLPMRKYKKYEKSEKRYMRLAQKLLSTADIQLNGDRPWDIRVYNPLLYRRVIRLGSLGFGEAFMDGWWDTNDFNALDVLFEKLLRSDIEHYFISSFKDAWSVVRAYLWNPQSRSKSKRVGMQHYDIGNAFFRNMLCPSMQYSCAYWVKHDPDGTPHTITNLDEAQEVKMRMIGEKLQLKEGMKVLDVGCGWGGLAHFLSENYGVHVTGITISKEQCKAAMEREEGNQRVTILLQDYRDLKPLHKFDRIVSVGMFEHVGHKNYKVFFKHMRRLLKDDDPNACMLLHTIGSKKTQVKSDPWYLKYIFPGGSLPSIATIGKSTEKYFVMEDLHNFGHFYSLTLMAWRERFLESWKNGSVPKPRQGANAFFRMFYYYLSSSAGAFRARDLQLWQIVLSPKGILGYPDIKRP